MASTVLPNGIIIPEKFSRDWYADLYHNWQELDNLLGGGGGGANDGTLTIQKNGTTVGTFSANQATDETINITVPDVNNGTLTIQKNGDTVGTFSANQATNETIDIEVPTKTSDLNNDSGFITGVSWNDVADKPSFATVATSGSYTDLSDKPTIPTVNNGTLTIQQNGTTVDTFTANSSSDKTVNIQCVDLTSNQTVGGDKEFTGTTTAHDLVPSATDTYNFGSSTAQWNNAYIKSLTINGVVCGDILTHNVSEFVDVSTVQTIGGRKIFSDSPRVKRTTPYIALDISDCDVTELPTEGKFASFFFRDKNTKNLAYITGQQRTDGTKRMCLRTHRTDNIDKYYSVSLDSNGDFYPEQNNAMNLGASALKWKSIYTNAINGLNPGALSLPSTSNDAMMQIDTTSWVLDGVADIEYIPSADGYLTLVNDQKLEWIKGQIQNDINYGIYRFVYKYDSDIGGIQGVTIPCIKGKKVIMKIKGTGFYNALFIYCQGNV
jgi:hypothetical protein